MVVVSRIQWGKWAFPLLLLGCVLLESVCIWYWKSGRLSCSSSSDPGFSRVWQTTTGIRNKGNRGWCVQYKAIPNLSNVIDGLFLHLEQEYPCERENESKNKKLWWTFTFVQHPTDRAEREFYRQTSLTRTPPTWDNFESFLLDPERTKNTSLSSSTSLPTKESIATGEKEVEELGVVMDVVDSFHFIGVLERLDESLVVMRRLLGLSWKDILFLPDNDLFGVDTFNKTAGCFLQVLPIRTKARSKLLRDLDDHHDHEVQLWKAAGRSLDSTVRSLNQKTVARDLQTFRRLQRHTLEQCLASTTYVCDINGDFHPNDHSCLGPNQACGHSCIMNLNLTPILAKG